VASVGRKRRGGQVLVESFLAIHRASAHACALSRRALPFQARTWPGVNLNGVVFFPLFLFFLITSGHKGPGMFFLRRVWGWGYLGCFWEMNFRNFFSENDSGDISLSHLPNTLPGARISEMGVPLAILFPFGNGLPFSLEMNQ